MISGFCHICSTLDKTLVNAASHIKSENKCMNKVLLITGIALLTLGIVVGISAPFIGTAEVFIIGPFISFKTSTPYILSSIAGFAVGIIAGYPMARIGHQLIHQQKN